jgi:leucyl aminopeptidase (aminopeptidase T)
MSIVELMKGYKLCVETCMGVKPGEHIVIITDLDNMANAKALAIASQMADANAIILCQTSLKKFTLEPPEMIVECMKKADVILVSLPFFYSALFFHTNARKEAVKNGARFAIVQVTPENADITREEIIKTKYLSEKIAALLNETKEVRVKTNNGTNLTMTVQGRKSVPISSLLDQPGASGTIPDFAEAAIAPIEGSAEGVVVIDGSISGIGSVQEPIVWKIRKGRLIEIKGKEEAQKLKDLLKKTDSNSTNIAELGIGTVARGKVTGDPDDKRILGTGHIAIGDNRFGGGNIASDIHLDGVFMNMTLELDGKVIMEDGMLKL